MLKVIVKFLNNIERYICIVLMAAMLILIAGQVFARFILNSPNQWSEELARYLHIYMIFIGGAYAARMRTHIQIDAMLNIWPKKIRPFCKLLGDILWLVFACYIVYIGVTMTANVAALGQTSAALKLGLKYVYAALPIGYSLLVIRMVQNWVIDFRARRKSSETEIETEKGDKS